MGTRTTLELVEVGARINMSMNDENIPSDDEYQDFVKFMQEYERKRKEKREESFLMRLYNIVNDKKR